MSSGPEVDDTQVAAERRNRDRRRRARVDVPREQVREVDVEELVAVQRIDRTGFEPLLRGETKASAPSERLRLADQHELDAHLPELLLEARFLARGAADQHTIDARLGEQSDLVRGQRAAPDRDERLGPALRLRRPAVRPFRLRG